MKQQNSKWMPLAFAVITMLLVQPLRAEMFEKTMAAGGMTVHYKVVLPNDYDPAKAYPAILAFGGGPQDMITVDNILNRNFRAEAEKRGYIVVAPAATLARYTVEKDQPHRLDTLAGVNAGRLFDGFEETKKGCQLQSR